MKNFLSFVVSIVVFVAIGLVARTFVGAEVGEACNDFVLSCRATRGIFTVNACVRTGPSEAESFCSYACRADSECPEGWTCVGAAAWSSVPGAADDVDRVCRRP